MAMEDESEVVGDVPGAQIVSNLIPDVHVNGRGQKGLWGWRRRHPKIKEYVDKQHELGNKVALQIRHDGRVRALIYGAAAGAITLAAGWLLTRRRHQKH